MTTYPYQHLYERDAFTCRLCGWNGAESFDHWWVAGFAITHITPPEHGGTDEDDNLILACQACIQHKGDAAYDTLEEAQEVVRKNREHAQHWFAKHIAPEAA